MLAGLNKSVGTSHSDSRHSEFPTTWCPSMKFFVDTADTAEIKSPAASGLLGGMTANPSLVAKTGKKFTDTIAKIFAIGPGAHVALFNHSLTDKGLAEFLADWSETDQKIA